MILTGHEVAREIEQGHIQITPYNPSQLNEGSYDLRLGGKVMVYQALSRMPKRSKRIADLSVDPAGWLDAALPNALRTFDFERGEEILIKPGIGYLMHTEERVVAHRHIPVLDGKSSVGRLFVSLHQTAGYGEPGFSGQWTLEVTCTSPVKLYAGMRIGQMRFHVPHGEIKKYSGNYAADAEGPVGSRSFKQIEQDIKENRLTLRV